MFAFFKVHLARGSVSIMGSLVGDRGRGLGGKIHWARTRPSAKSLPTDAEGKAGKRQSVPPCSKSCYDTKLPVRGNLSTDT